MRVHFRNFDYEKDLKRLFSYMVKDENQILFSHGFQIHNIVMFENWLTGKFSRNEYHDFFIIENESGEAVGFTFSYDFFNYDAHCKYTLCLYEKYQNCGIGALAGIKMMNYLFSRYPLKQIFISVFDYNKNSLSANLKAGFKEVGVLPDYRYCKGEFGDMHILTMSRSTFYNRYENLLNSKILNKTTNKSIT